MSQINLQNKRYFHHVLQASDGKREAKEERQTGSTGEGAEKLTTIHTPLFVLFPVHVVNVAIQLANRYHVIMSCLWM